MRPVLRLLRLALIIGVSACLLAATAVLVAPYTYKIANANSAEDEELDLRLLDDVAVRSYIYAADDTLLAKLHRAENRLPVALALVPEPVKESIIAVEDADFYTHPGVNMRATFRALLENVSSGGIQQGGSTITQQLVKNALDQAEPDLERKSREAALAVRLEKRLSKDQILEYYLNTVYFGSGAYGVQAAAETYFDTNVWQLDWGQAALLASLIRSPVYNDPILHPATSRRQRQLALDRLATLGKISAADAERYSRTPLPLARCGGQDPDRAQCKNSTPPAKQDYFSEMVRLQLLHNPFYGIGSTPEEREQAVYGGGLKVKTTLFPLAQVSAYQAREAVLPKIGGLTAAMVSVEPGSGAVRAMLGGPGFDFYEHNIATEGLRQTGSAFKGFALLTALEQGAVPSDFILGGGDFPCPACKEKVYRMPGPGGTLTSVTTVSSNGAFVRLGLIDGLPNVVAMARKLGVTAPIEDPPPLSLPLGTKEVTPLEMASAYSSIPNGGNYQPWHVIESIQDRNGRVIYQHRPTPQRVYSQQTACLATQILEENVKSGTGRNANLAKQPAAGKTGTTNDGADTWFIGYTPFLTTAVWVGDVSPGPDGQPRRNPVSTIAGRANFGGEFPAELWGNFNERYHSNLPVQAFPKCQPTRPGRFINSSWDYLLPADAPPNPFMPFPPPSNDRRATPPKRTPGATGPTATTPNTIGPGPSTTAPGPSTTKPAPTSSAPPPTGGP